MTEDKLIKIINTEIDRFVKDALDNEINKILRSSNSKSRDELIKTIKNSFEGVYKMLWVKRDFWKNDIK